MGCMWWYPIENLEDNGFMGNISITFGGQVRIKLLREAKTNAKAAYYSKAGTLASISKIVRKDSEVRPPR